MKTTDFDLSVATEVENAVIDAFCCDRSNIVQFIDSEVKKVVVFFLYYQFGFNKRIIGHNYKMTHWYVPTACEEIKVMYQHDVNFQLKIDNVFGILNLKKIVA